MQAPGTLVLGGGGILGEAWMLAVLAGIEEAAPGFDPRLSAGFIGTSAGSIVAACLAGGVTPAQRLGAELGAARSGVPAGTGEAAGLEADGIDEPRGPRTAASARAALGRAAGVAGVLSSPLASAALASAAVPGALLRRGLLRGAGPGTRSLQGLAARIDGEGVRFDGRLVVVAVDEASGKRVAFGTPGAPAASVGEAVEASCAIPGFFEPVTIGGRRYVDGGVWSPTNIDLARVPRGAKVLCLNPTGSLRPSVGAPAGAIGPVSRTIAAAEAGVLRLRGAGVRVVNPDRDSAAAMGINLMRSAARAEVIAAGLVQGRRLGRPRARGAA